MRVNLFIPLLFAFTSLLFTCCLTACNDGKEKNTIDMNAMENSKSLPYNLQQAPDSATSYLPGIVSSDSLDFNAAFSPDHKSFYFSRAANRISKIYFTRFDSNQWSPPIAAPFATDNSADADPAFGPDGKLYFISNRLTSPSDTLPDYDIWFVSPLADGGWSSPQNMHSINSDSNEFYVSFAQNGNLYFSSSRQGGFGQEDIYVSKWENGKYDAPENLGSLINSDKSEYDPGISPKEDMLVFASSKRDGSYGMADLYISTPNADKKWLIVYHPGPGINTSTRDYCPYFSPNGQAFFFTSDKDVKWISVQSLRKAAGLK